MEVCYKCKLVIKEDEDYINAPWGWATKVKMHVECYKKLKQSYWIFFGIFIFVVLIIIIVLFVIFF